MNFEFLLQSSDTIDIILLPPTQLYIAGMALNFLTPALRMCWKREDHEGVKRTRSDRHPQTL